jgi:hypothetical protein
MLAAKTGAGKIALLKRHGQAGQVFGASFVSVVSPTRSTGTCGVLVGPGVRAVLGLPVTGADETTGVFSGSTLLKNECEKKPIENPRAMYITGKNKRMNASTVYFRQNLKHSKVLNFYSVRWFGSVFDCPRLKMRIEM